jgi:Na+-driven multidrug efflux pump
MLRIPLATYLAHEAIAIPGTEWVVKGLALGVVGAWYAMAVDVVFRCTLFIGRFLHGGWQRVEV